MTTQLIADVMSPDVYRNGDPATNGLPLEAYAQLREQAPCYRHPLSDPLMVDNIWVLTRYEDVTEVDRNAEVFRSQTGHTARLFTPFEQDYGGKPAMIGLDGQEHRKNRGVVAKAFTPKVIRAFEAHFRSICSEIVDRAVSKGTVDFVPEVAIEMPLDAISHLMGVPKVDRPKFLAWVNAMAVPTDPEYAPSPEAALEAVANLWQYGLELADKRREVPGDDLMSRIVAATDADTLSEDELMGFTVLLAGAGSDTTRNAFSHGLYALLKNPEQMAYLRANADDVPNTAVQEIVRWASPVIHFSRTAEIDTEIAGQEIAAGDRVAMLFPSANFDPTTFDDPHMLDLTRDPNPHVSFGVGPHACLGKHVAALEMKLLFEELMKRTSKIELAGEIGYVRDNLLRGVHTLPVTLHGV